MKILLLALGILLVHPLSAVTPPTSENDRHMLSEMIRARMDYYKVPALSLAVINNGTIEWTQGYGHVTSRANSSSIDSHTLFQAGSISVPITAFGALMLVQRGKISLDEDVNVYLKRWKIPENPFSQTEKVTLRRLLSHTAGINMHAFPGLRVQAAMPNLIDLLEGLKPSLTPPVRVISTPGSEWKYSGGGILIVQLLIEDVTGESFAIWMQNNVLNPLGMTESTFKQPLPASYASHSAHGCLRGGIPLASGRLANPHLAAAGLWSTPHDLAQFIVYIQLALKNRNAEPLNTFYVQEMLTRQSIGARELNYGLGFSLRNDGENLVFTHSGKEAGFLAYLYGYAYQDQGIVMMVNSSDGKKLMDEIMTSIAEAYAWQDFQPVGMEGI